MGLRSCLASILRLWQCPQPSKPIVEPYDPDVESAQGVWPEGKNGTRAAQDPKFEAPTVQQVLQVKRMFASMRFTKLEVRGLNGDILPPLSAPPLIQPSQKEPIQLPPEVCDMILDLAGYWPCSKTVVSRLMLISNGSPGPTSVWMDKERDWRGNTPGASTKSQPWRRTPSTELDRALDEGSTAEASTVVSGIYLRSFPLGGDMKLVVPDSVKTATAKKKPKPKSAEVSTDTNMTDSNSSWQKLSNILRNGTWKTPIGSVVELDKRNDEAPANRGVLTTTVDGTMKSPRHYASRPLHPAETRSWCLEIDELYPNVRPDIDHEKFEKKVKRRTRKQWRSFYTMSHFHRWVIPIYQLYSSTREEKFLVERTVQSTSDVPFARRNILEPRLIDRTLSHNGERRMKSAKVRKIVWTIWSKEMIDRSMNERRVLVNPEGTPDLTWFEMFVEEPVAKGPADPEIVWKRKYPKGNENILVQRDLGHRIRTTDPRMRIHRAEWDWNDWEDTEPDDDGEEGNWRYQGISQLDLGNILTGPTHPFHHTIPKNYCNCPFGTKLYWGDAVDPSKVAPVSSRLKPGEVSAPAGSPSATSSSSSGSPSSSSTTSSSSSSESSSTNSSSNSLPSSTKPVHSYIAPNTVFEERFKTGSLRKNGALGKLVRSLKMGDRLVLVARTGGGLGWSQHGHRWDVGVFRAEVEVYWAV